MKVPGISHVACPLIGSQVPPAMKALESLFGIGGPILGART